MHGTAKILVLLFFFPFPQSTDTLLKGMYCGMNRSSALTPSSTAFSSVDMHTPLMDEKYGRECPYLSRQLTGMHAGILPISSLWSHEQATRHTRLDACGAVNVMSGSTHCIGESIFTYVPGA